MPAMPVAAAPPGDPHWESKQRRRYLNEEMGVAEDGSILSVVSVSSFFPIERYYDAAGKVLASFEEAYANHELDTAYVYGKRYCSFVIHSIPQHNYYLSPKYSKLRAEHTTNVEVIVKFLEKIVSSMDEEEKIKRVERERRAKIEAQRREAERKRQEQLRQEREAKEYEALLKRAALTTQTKKSSTTTTGGANVQESALSKLSLLSQKSNGSSSAVSEKPKRSSGRYALSSDDEEEEDGEGGTDAPPSYGHGVPLPPPLLPPSEEASHRTSSNGSSTSQQHSASNGSLPEAPPPYEFATNSNRHNPFLGPIGKNGVKEPYPVPPPVKPWNNAGPPGYGTVVGSSSLPDPPTRRHSSSSSRDRQPKSKKQKKVPLRHMREQARQRYQELQQQGRIEIRPVDTYQGRYSQSTNGCTVISPLVVARHLKSSSGVILPDNEIKDVIDNECGPLLREIRGKLGLENHSLIIPSDVHDHLVDKKILKQEFFVGATGGNIICEEHIEEIFKLFHERSKAGAVLFFREHVISIVKIPVGSGQAYFDFIDSMPGTTDSRNRPCASRTRCKDANALRDLLKWYATKKFSDSNCSYIDRNDWNDNMADFDPRVFQAFVWGRPSQ